MSEGPGLSYFMKASDENITIEIKDIELEEKTELSEKILVTLLEGEETEKVHLIFSYDSKGLITEVTVG